ncbi:RDD family protein [Lysobacter cavernae]|uniref:RDD family protein n=1 Tax=Lysobacter cavernae TaxID=1685901 RepID=A0ABV7RSD8_9GAMM
MIAAGFWQRYAAWSLDAALLAVPTAALAAPSVAAHAHVLGDLGQALLQRIYTTLAEHLLQAESLPAAVAAVLHDPALAPALTATHAALLQLLLAPTAAFVLLGALYHAVAEASPWQGGAGKRALGLAVSDRRGARLDVGRAGLRHLAGGLSWLTLNLGHLLAAVAPAHRALHDRFSGTQVMALSGSRRLPAWARLWLGIQVIAAVAASAWLGLLTAAMAQRALEAALR